MACNHTRRCPGSSVRPPLGPPGGSFVAPLVRPSVRLSVGRPARPCIRWSSGLSVCPSVGPVVVWWIGPLVIPSVGPLIRIVTCIRWMVHPHAGPLVLSSASWSVRTSGNRSVGPSVHQRTSMIYKFLELVPSVTDVSTRNLPLRS